MDTVFCWLNLSKSVSNFYRIVQKTQRPSKIVWNINQKNLWEKFFVFFAGRKPLTEGVN